MLSNKMGFFWYMSDPTHLTIKEEYGYFLTSLRTALDPCLQHELHSNRFPCHVIVNLQFSYWDEVHPPVHGKQEVYPVQEAYYIGPQQTLLLLGCFLVLWLALLQCILLHLLCIEEPRSISIHFDIWYPHDELWRLGGLIQLFWWNHDQDHELACVRQLTLSAISSLQFLGWYS